LYNSTGDIKKISTKIYFKRVRKQFFFKRAFKKIEKIN
jgi:hypothetical protein